MEKILKFLKDKTGATATEYAVMLALIIVVAIIAISILGQNVANTFSNVASMIP